VSAVVELLAAVVDVPVVVGAAVRHERAGFFSTVEDAERWIHGRTGSPPLWYIALVGQLDGAWEPEQVVFDRDGRIVEDWRGEPERWAGRRPEDCGFAVGEPVLCVHEGHLALGTVERQPPTPGFAAGMDRSDDRYLVTFPDGGHEHAPEYRLRRPSGEGDQATARL
jgi:hypothetical protein